MAATLLVVGGDPFGDLRADILDAVGLIDDLGVAKGQAAGMAEAVIREVAGTAAGADLDRAGWQAGLGGDLSGVAEREDCPDHTVGSPFVVDEAPGSELGEGKEPWPLEEGLASVARAVGYVRQERQAREVVAGQEPLGCKVPVRVEVAGAGARVGREQVDLVLRLSLADPRHPLFGGR